MRIFTVFLLSMVLSCSSFAQAGEESFGPKLLALDSNILYTEPFTRQVASLLPQYTLLLLDKEKQGILKYVYKTQENETLRFEYKYHKSEGNVASVTFQRIVGDAEAIAAIYNFLFDSDISADKLPMVQMADTELTYKGEACHTIIEPDEYAPGYWSISFFR